MMISSDDEQAMNDHRKNIEIGGHGWDSLTPVMWHRTLKLCFGSHHGPRLLQQRMIRQICKLFHTFLNQPVWSWRNHAYRLTLPGLLKRQVCQIKKYPYLCTL